MISPHLKFVRIASVLPLLSKYANEHAGSPLFLDIGGGSGSRCLKFAKGYTWSVLDITSGENVICADICKRTPIDDGAFDITFSYNVFEHLSEPWLAAEECVRITKPGGLTVHIAPFAWRYHPVPQDYYRFSHSGMTHLFERTKLIDTVTCGYDIDNRRSDNTNSRMFKNNEDVPPVDDMGGWRENWSTVYVGRKRG